MMSLLTTLCGVAFVVSLGLIVYHHLLYPKLLELAARELRRTASARALGLDVQAGELPSVGVIVPCYNEARYIAGKVRNLCALDYPPDKLSIVIALDGCTDDTGRLALQAAQEYAEGRSFSVVSYDANQGKIAVLNDQISALTCDIVALTDASAEFAPDAVLRAVAHFRAADVGVVAATYRLAQAGSEGERAYIGYLTRMRSDEALLGTPLGVHGALYFFRRVLWRPLPPDTINDDFVMPLQIVEQGYRGVYDTGIIAVEREKTADDQDFKRRRRLGAGNLQQSLRLWRLYDPHRPLLAWMFASGKGMRPFIPAFAIVAFVSGLWLAACGSIAAGLIVLVGIAGVEVGRLPMRTPQYPWPKVLRWLGYLVDGHTASGLGALDYLMGRRIAGWQPPSTVRPQAVIIWSSKASSTPLEPPPAVGELPSTPFTAS